LALKNQRGNKIMLEPNSDLESIFERAVKLAVKNKHEYITLEHFLYSLIIDSKFEKWTKAVGQFIKPVAQPITQALTERAVGEIKSFNKPESRNPDDSPASGGGGIGMSGGARSGVGSMSGGGGSLNGGGLQGSQNHNSNDKMLDSKKMKQGFYLAQSR
jgi:uncharacterized membrane protein YgcG